MAAQDIESNDTIGEANSLGVISLQGGGSQNSSTFSETVQSSAFAGDAADPRDWYYFSHFPTLEQVYVSADSIASPGHIRQGGIYGETQQFTVTPSTGLSGERIRVEVQWGLDAYKEEFLEIRGHVLDIWSELGAYSGTDGVGYDADVAFWDELWGSLHALFEKDGQDLDSDQLAADLRFLAGESRSTAGFAESIRTELTALAGLVDKWEKARYLQDLGDGNGYVESSSLGTDTVVWDVNASTQRAYFVVTGSDVLSRWDGGEVVNPDILGLEPWDPSIEEKIAITLEVPTIEVSGKREGGGTPGGSTKPTPGDDDLQLGSNNTTLDAGRGNDTVRAGGGNDKIYGNVGNDIVYGQKGHDTLEGGSGNDRLDGGSGTDTLKGGSGTDTLVGGSGNDTYILQSGSDKIRDSSGTDTITSTISRDLTTYDNQIENLWLLGSGNLSGKGTSVSNLMVGNAGNNTISAGFDGDVVLGGNGRDTLKGESGDDWLFGDDSYDLFPIGSGKATGAVQVDLPASLGGERAWRMDTAFSVSSVDDIEAGANWPHMSATRVGHGKPQWFAMDVIPGLLLSADIDAVTGGADLKLTLYDPMGKKVGSIASGSEGDSTPDGVYISATDSTLFLKVTTSSGGGIPASVSYTLHATVMPYFDLPNLPKAMSPGSDVLYGGAGNDGLYGGGGDDRLIGGLHADRLHGGTGADRFVYNSADESSPHRPDSILDFGDRGADRIDLSALAAGKLEYRGTHKFDDAGQVHVIDVSGPDVLVTVNLDDDLSTAETRIVLVRTELSSLSADDFVL